ncbi:FK506-binding protein 2B [Rhizoclosmatium sp. JEL0117]|nr:FK506-binding protein 2B [Rhizoclosmatium sp. JEL0117]
MAPEAVVTEQPWTEADLKDEKVSKKELVDYILANANFDFIVAKKFTAKPALLVKNTKRNDLVQIYKDLFASSSFRSESDPSLEEALAKLALEKQAAKKETSGTAKAAESTHVAPVKKEKVVAPPKYTKVITSKGDSMNFPVNGDSVSVFYTGKYNGVVFDTNQVAKKPVALKVQVGRNTVCRGWDEALLTMSKNEKATITIESEWAFGKKGKPEFKIPPGANVVYELHLAGIND